MVDLNMKLQPHYFCPQGPQSQTKHKLRKGDVKACYVRIKRRWVRTGTICLDCVELPQNYDSLLEKTERKHLRDVKKKLGGQTKDANAKHPNEEVTVSPRRWGTNTRAWVYRFLVLRDGEQCVICHATPTTQNPTTQNTLDIDHIDGNPNNNDPDNLRLLCRRCNVTAANRPRSPKDLRSAKCVRERKEGNPSTRIIREDANYREGSPEMQANYLCEVRFRRWLIEKVATTGGYDKHTAIAEGAELFGPSIETTARYTTKLTSPAGPLTEIKDTLGHPVLILRPQLQTPANES